MTRRKGPLERLFSRLVAWRLGGYRQRLNPGAEVGPRRPAQPRRVAVVGGGLAGISAAANLAERGVRVDLYERNAYLGGKLGAWDAVTSDGSVHPVEHGFHAFFRTYYNLSAFLDRIGASGNLAPIADYQVLSRDGTQHSYRDTATTPVANLLSLARKGYFDLWQVARNPASAHLRAMLEYDEAVTFHKFDDLSFAEFARIAQIPDALMLSFNTFARAFFSTPEQLSTAELLKSFHFYYLCTDAGLLYDVPTDDHAVSLLAPMRAHLDANGVSVRLGQPVTDFERTEGGFRVQGTDYDAVVLALDPEGMRALARRLPWLTEQAPTLARDLTALGTGVGYAVLRLWFQGDVPWPHCPYLVTERVGALDAIAAYHHLERTSRAHFDATGEAVFELHSYAIPAGDPSDQQVRDALLEGFYHYVPSARQVPIAREHLYLRRDFTAFHTGHHARRPPVQTAIDGLLLAGDWVRLPTPAMLMEAAYTSGLLAANHLFDGWGLAQEPVWTVPRRGLLAGVPGSKALPPPA